MTQRINFGIYVPAQNAMTLNRGRAPRTMAADRVCAAGDCDTHLSIYNQGTECSVHEPLRPSRSHGVRKARRA